MLVNHVLDIVEVITLILKIHYFLLSILKMQKIAAIGSGAFTQATTT
jgi:hypothetical protein